MSDYRRLYQPGGTYFFTVVTVNRRPLFSSDVARNLLRAGFRELITQRPFDLEAIVVLPDHLHCLWRMPEGDKDFSNRWKILKGYVTRRLVNSGKPVWQPRFWEHLIRDGEDWQRHLDYIHFNPVKHGLVKNPAAWPYSSFQKYRKLGVYPGDWGKIEPEIIATMDLE